MSESPKCPPLDENVAMAVLRLLLLLRLACVSAHTARVLCWLMTVRCSFTSVLVIMLCIATWMIIAHNNCEK